MGKHSLYGLGFLTSLQWQAFRCCLGSLLPIASVTDNNKRYGTFRNRCFRDEVLMAVNYESKGL